MKMLKILFFIIYVGGFFSNCKEKTPENKGTQVDAEAAAPEGKGKSSLPLDKIKLPEGFSISLYATKVPGARSMAMGAEGTLFVGTKDDKVYAVRDENNDGTADKVYTIAKGLKSPNGVAFRDGSLYVAEISKVSRYDNIEQNLANPPAPVVVNNSFPTNPWHGWKYIAFGPDGKLYIPVGAPCNICEIDYGKYGNIMRMNPDGSELEVYAKGIRNTVGFDWQPGTNDLWFTDNGRDEMGDNVPADELNRAHDPNMNFGYPYCHQGDVLDPKFGKNHECAEYIPPMLKLGVHVAALGMKFYTGDQFPAEYKNNIFIAEHGSWNKSSKVGYRVTLVKLDENFKAVSYTPFAEGWLKPNGDVWGRPVDILVMKDGSLLVSDDMAGVVYKISYRK